MSETKIPHILTIEDVYKIQNDLLIDCNPWKADTPEEINRTLFYWEGVVELANCIVRKINGED